jgi:hypothetical protein
MTTGGNSRFLCFVLLSTVIACGGSANTCEAAAGDHDYVAVRTSITAPACADLPQSILVRVSIRANAWGSKDWTITEDGIAHPGEWIGEPFDQTSCFGSASWTDGSVDPFVFHEYVLQRGDASLQLQRFMSCGARYALSPR